MRRDRRRFHRGDGRDKVVGLARSGFKFLTITDTHALTGKIIYVLREVGSASAQFTLTVD
jgi:hypothetical protein